MPAIARSYGSFMCAQHASIHGSRSNNDNDHRHHHPHDHHNHHNHRDRREDHQRVSQKYRPRQCRFSHSMEYTLLELAT